MFRKASEKRGSGKEQAEGVEGTGKRSDVMGRPRKGDSSASTVADNSPDSTSASASKTMTGLFRPSAEKTSGDPASPSLDPAEQPSAWSVLRGRKKKR